MSGFDRQWELTDDKELTLVAIQVNTLIEVEFQASLPSLKKVEGPGLKPCVGNLFIIFNIIKICAFYPLFGLNLG